MGLITLGDSVIRGIDLGDVNVTGVWLGDILVWPTDPFDCHSQLLDERSHGFRGYVGEHPEVGERIFQIDRAFWPGEYALVDIVTDSNNEANIKSLEYESRNNYPYKLTIARDDKNVHPDRDYEGIIFDTLNGDELNIKYESPRMMSYDPETIIVRDFDALHDDGCYITATYNGQENLIDVDTIHHHFYQAYLGFDILTYNGLPRVHYDNSSMVADGDTEDPRSFEYEDPRNYIYDAYIGLDPADDWHID